MNEPWVSKLTQIVQTRVDRNEPFKRGELTGIYKELATEFNVENTDKLMNYYYRVLKKLWGEESSTKKGKKTSTKKGTSKKPASSKARKKTEGDNQESKSEENNNKQTTEELNSTNSSTKSHINTKTDLNEIKFVTSKLDNEPIKLAFLKSYPAPSIQINSLEEELEPTTEWINFSQVNRNIDGDAFDNYVRTLQNGELIKKGLFNNKEIDIIEINALKRILGTFSGYSRNKRVKEQAEAISSILSADDATVSQKREEYYFNSLKPNDLVEVEVKKVLDYGAIAYLTEFTNITGLLHIGQLTRGYVKNIQDYLYEGQILQVKILKKDKNRLEFSTKDLALKPIEEIQKEKLNFEESAPTLEPTEINSASSPIKEKRNQDESNSKEIGSEVEPETASEANDSLEKTLNNANLNAEWDRIIEYVKAAVGPLSPDAKKKTISLINEYGLFNFTLALQSASLTFKADMGLLLLRETEMKLRDGL